MKARDAAILARLHIAPATLAALITVMPEEPGFTVEDKTVACKSALIRLGYKKRVRQVEGGWAVA